MGAHSIFRGALSALLLAFAPAASADCPEDLADAVVGQSNFVTNAANQPNGMVSAAGLALSNAAAVCVAPNGRLYASDPDNHRVLSWPSAVALASGQPADRVLGQPDFFSGAPNNGGVSARSFNLPQGVFADSDGNIWVADAFNSRVLRFNDPESDATPLVADLVVGQPDFVHNAENLGLGGDGPHVALPDSLQFPGRVVVAGDDLYIADSGNSRVLHYQRPEHNKPAADIVFGQYGNLFCRAKNNDGNCENGFSVTAGNMKNPIGIAVDRAGQLFVADWANHRVLRFTAPLVSQTATGVIGQPDLTSNSFNNGGPQIGLGLPIDLVFDRLGRLWLADSGNNRVLTYNAPASDSEPACVFGQLGSLLTTGSNHGLGPFACDRRSLFGPTGLAVDRGRGLIVADTNNQRILRFRNIVGLHPLANVEGLVPQAVESWPP